MSLTKLYSSYGDFSLMRLGKDRALWPKWKPYSECKEQERAQEERAQNPTFDATWSDWADAPEIQWNDNH